MTVNNRRFISGVFTAVITLLLLLPVHPAISGPQAAESAGSGILKNGKVTLTLRDTEISEVMEMLSRAAQVNILLSDAVKGNISVNLYDVSIDDAINAIVTSAGYGVERRRGSYFIVARAEAGKNSPGGPTQ